MSMPPPSSTRRGGLRDAGHGNFVRTWSTAREAAWMLVEILVFRNPFQVSSRLRTMALRAFGARVGARVRIREGARVKYPWLLEMGDDCWIGERAWLYNQAALTIGSDTCISQDCFVTCGTHDLRTMELHVVPVSIGDRVWLAARVTVLPGVSIGDDIVVATGAVVTESLDGAGSIYAGVPARLIGQIPGG